jgi:hypothetical protein
MEKVGLAEGGVEWVFIYATTGLGSASALGLIRGFSWASVVYLLSIARITESAVVCDSVIGLCSCGR